MALPDDDLAHLGAERINEDRFAFDAFVEFLDVDDFTHFFIDWYGFLSTGTEPRLFINRQGPLQLMGTNRAVYRFFLLFAGAAAGFRLRAAPVRKSTEATSFLIRTKNMQIYYIFPNFYPIPHVSKAFVPLLKDLAAKAGRIISLILLKNS